MTTTMQDGEQRPAPVATAPLRAKPKLVQMLLRVPPGFLDLVKAQAAVQRLSMSAYIVKFVEDRSYLEATRGAALEIESPDGTDKAVALALLVKADELRAGAEQVRHMAELMLASRRVDGAA